VIDCHLNKGQQLKGPFMTNEINLCALCAAQGPTCCQGKDRDIYITLGDLKRISEHAGNKDFYEFRRPVNPAYSDEDDDPMWIMYVFRRDGTRRVLKRNGNDGDCIFLTAGGCRLPLQVRPLICRLYPYAFTASGLSSEWVEGCPIHLLTPGQSLNLRLGIAAEDAVSWHRTLYNEILFEKNDEHWTDLRPAI